MIVGTVVGVAQTNVKRMLAYSSIAHGGYLLVALVSANDVGKGAVLFYLLTYAVTNIGAFGVDRACSRTRTGRTIASRDYAGLWSTHPVLAVLMTIFLLSLGGFPPFGGLHREVVRLQRRGEGRLYWLAIIGVLTSVVSVFFYLRIVVMMYMTPTDNPARFPAVPRIAGAALIVSAILVVLPRHPADAGPRPRPRFDRDHLLDLK